MYRCTVGLILGLALVACGQPRADSAESASAESGVQVGARDTAAPVIETPPTAAAARLVLAGDGLRVVDTVTGSTRPIDFGTPADGAIEMLSAVLGSAPSARGACPTAVPAP